MQVLIHRKCKYIFLEHIALRDDNHDMAKKTSPSSDDHLLEPETQQKPLRGDPKRPLLVSQQHHNLVCLLRTHVAPGHVVVTKAGRIAEWPQSIDEGDRQEGRLQGLHDGLLLSLAARSLHPDDRQAAALQACTDEAQLARWILLAGRIESIDELFID